MKTFLIPKYTDEDLKKFFSPEDFVEILENLGYKLKDYKPQFTSVNNQTLNIENYISKVTLKNLHTLHCALSDQKNTEYAKKDDVNLNDKIDFHDHTTLHGSAYTYNNVDDNDFASMMVDHQHC